MFGNLSYLNVTYTSVWLLRETSLPLHNGRETSMETWTRMKLPPSNNLGSDCLNTSPTTPYIFLAAPMFIYLVGIPWTYTHRVVRSNLISSKGVSWHCMTTKCLSKLHGSLLKILSTSSLLSKVKRILWSPKFWISKPLRALHNGVKVLAMTSTFRALLVKNFATMEYSLTVSSPVRQQPGPSLSEIVSRF